MNRALAAALSIDTTNFDRKDYEFLIGFFEGSLKAFEHMQKHKLTPSHNPNITMIKNSNKSGSYK